MCTFFNEIISHKLINFNVWEYFDTSYICFLQDYIYDCHQRHHLQSRRWTAHRLLRDIYFLTWHRRNFDLAESLEELSPYGSPRQGPPGQWNFSDKLTAWVVPHTKTLSSNNCGAYNLGAYSTLVYLFHHTHNCETRDNWDSLIHLVTYVSYTCQDESAAVRWGY